MSSRAEHFRRLGFQAQQRAAQTSEEKIREAFQIVAEGWFELAEQEERRDKQQPPAEPNHTPTEAVEPDDKYNEGLRSVPMACRPVSRSRPDGLNPRRTGRLAGQGENVGLPGRALSTSSAVAIE